jgi:hypothetical protein
VNPCITRTVGSLYRETEAEAPKEPYQIKQILIIALLRDGAQPIVLVATLIKAQDQIVIAPNLGN